MKRNPERRVRVKKTYYQWREAHGCNWTTFYVSLPLMTSKGPHPLSILHVLVCYSPKHFVSSDFCLLFFTYTNYSSQTWQGNIPRKLLMTHMIGLKNTNKLLKYSSAVIVEFDWNRLQLTPEEILGSLLPMRFCYKTGKSSLTSIITLILSKFFKSLSKSL